MFGAIIGDIVGSRFEYDNIKSKDFELFTNDCKYTDDTVMTLAMAKAVLEARNGSSPSSPELLRELAIRYMRFFGNKFKDSDYGPRFTKWLENEIMQEYGSYGNGAAMRISPIAYAFYRSKDLFTYSKAVTEVTHNHPQSIKGAEATCLAIKMALNHAEMSEIYSAISEKYYQLDKSLDEIRPTYQYEISCDGTVPVAILAFLESDSFEDAIRNAISVGGDSDTVACITGSIAGAYYPIPEEIKRQALSYLPGSLLGVCEEWERFTL